ncbi:MAG: hypothetical protein LBU37_03590 [Tannerellaceae bacterium]|jgi:hypothetical protein|nr:hypothetical protein [Tannerellaceae bacterium]
MNEFKEFIDAIPTYKYHPFKGYAWTDETLTNPVMDELQAKFKTCLCKFEEYIFSLDKNDRTTIIEKTIIELIEAALRAEWYRLTHEETSTADEKFSGDILEMTLHNGIKHLMISMKELKIAYSTDFVSRLNNIANSEVEYRSKLFWLKAGRNLTKKPILLSYRYKLFWLNAILRIIFREKTSSQSNSDNISFDSTIIDKVYNECNGKLWVSIEKDAFISMLNTGILTIQIRKGNKQRVIALFNRLGMLIENKTQWVKTVEQSLGVGIRLNRVLKLDEINSDQNKEFNRFLDGIYSL